MVERAPVVFPLGEDRVPRQAGLRALEDQELEQRAVVAHRHAPLAVVIRDRERIARPAAAARLGHNESESASTSAKPVRYVNSEPMKRRMWGRFRVGVTIMPVACE